MSGDLCYERMIVAQEQLKDKPFAVACDGRRSKLVVSSSSLALSETIRIIGLSYKPHLPFLRVGYYQTFRLIQVLEKYKV